MKRLIAMSILKMCAKATVLTIIAAIIILVIGSRNEWDTSIKYSNAFFIAGSLMIIAGALSRLGAGQEWGNFQYLYAESFRGMSSSERANFILNVSSSLNLVILGLLSGLFLILISAILI